MPTLSVIIPIYNAVDKGLRCCIESVLAQTFSSYELILVNDGSTDTSLSVCREYAHKDSRIRIIDKENHGVSAARNSGIEASHGEWITFIDSDDWIEPSYFEELLKISVNSDFVICGMTQHFENNKNDIIFNAPEGGFNLNNPAAFHALVQSRLIFGPCNKLLRMSVICRYGIKFPENINYGEDRLFCYEYLSRINSFVGTNSTHYHYVVQSGNSLSTIARDNLFDLEYAQWQQLRSLYERHKATTPQSDHDLCVELYWMINDAIYNDYKNGIQSRKRINRYLSVPEMPEIKKYTECIKANPLLKTAITSRNAYGVMMFYKLLNICRK